MIRTMPKTGLLAALKLVAQLGRAPALWLSGAVALSACSAEAPRAETGRLTMGLVAEVDGVSYRLRDAQFEVAGPATLTIDTEDDPDATAVQRVLASGSYTMALRDGWHLERRLSPELPFETVDATLTSPNPSSFDIAEDETTNVAYVFNAGGATVPIGRGSLNLTIQVAANGPEVTPIATDRDAAQALYSVLVTQANVSRGFYMAAAAEATALEMLSLVDTSGVPELIADPSAELPASVSIECPEGGEISATWSRATATELIDRAADLRVEFDHCLGRQRPEESSWLAEDKGAIRVRVLATPELTLRVSSVRYGEGDTAYERNGQYRSESVPAFRRAYSYEVTGQFTQNPDLQGAFSYAIDGRSREEYFYLFSDEAGEWSLGSTVDSSTASQLLLSGSWDAEIPAQRAMSYHFRSGGLLRESADPWSSSSLSLSFADFGVDFLERGSEGNKSVTMAGVVSVDSTPAGTPPCAQGTYRVTTLESLLDENNDSSGPPEIIQGKLRLNDDVYVTFERKQQLRISRSDSASVVYHGDVSARSALSASLTCPDYF